MSQFRDKTGREIEIRRTTENDVDLFMIFQPQVASESTHTLQRVGAPPDRVKMANWWKKTTPDKKDLFLGAFYDGRLVGTLGLHEEYGGGHPWVAHSANFGMMILKEFYGSGLSEQLVNTMFAHAKGHGIRRISGLVRENNPRGVRFYEKCGFEVEGRRRLAAIIDGQELDELYIAKFL